MVSDLLQPTQIVIILVIALLVLGPKRLPDAGRALGQGLHGFRDGVRGQESDPADPLPMTVAESSNPSDTAGD